MIRRETLIFGNPGFSEVYVSLSCVGQSNLCADQGQMEGNILSGSTVSSNALMVKSRVVLLY